MWFPNEVFHLIRNPFFLFKVIQPPFCSVHHKAAVLTTTSDNITWPSRSGWKALSAVMTLQELTPAWTHPALDSAGNVLRSQCFYLTIYFTPATCNSSFYILLHPSMYNLIVLNIFSLYTENHSNWCHNFFFYFQTYFWKLRKGKSILLTHVFAFSFLCFLSWNSRIPSISISFLSREKSSL